MLRTLLRCRVTEDDMQQALKRRSPCPVALAINRALASRLREPGAAQRVWVSGEMWGACGSCSCWPLPARARDFVQDWDYDQDPGPVSFNLDITQYLEDNE